MTQAGGPASARWPATAFPAPPQAGVAHAVQRPESTRAASPPGAGHRHSRWPARSGAARAATVPAQTAPAGRSGSPVRAIGGAAARHGWPTCDDSPATARIDQSASVYVPHRRFHSAAATSPIPVSGSFDSCLYPFRPR